MGIFSAISLAFFIKSSAAYIDASAITDPRDSAAPPLYPRFYHRAPYDFSSEHRNQPDPRLLANYLITQRYYPVILQPVILRQIAVPFLLRRKRQSFPPRPAPYQPRVEDYNLPPFYQPYPGRDASSLSPIFPFTSQFNNGLDVNPGTRVTVDGNLNVPLMGWGIWDYKGGIKVGRPNTRVGFGSLARPTNVLGITPETLAILGSNGLFNEARSRLPSIPVSVLPGNFVPLRCKPPFCNPFLHNLAFGVDVEPGDDVLFDGGVDFPIPLAPGGVGVRYPISGAVNVGSDPFLLTYGHGLGPVEPPNFSTKNLFKKTKDEDEQ